MQCTSNVADLVNEGLLARAKDLLIAGRRKDCTAQTFVRQLGISLSSAEHLIIELQAAGLVGPERGPGGYPVLASAAQAGGGPRTTVAAEAKGADDSCTTPPRTAAESDAVGSGGSLPGGPPAAAIVRVDVDRLKIHPQVRVRLNENEDVIRHYADLMLEGHSFRGFSTAIGFW